MHSPLCLVYTGSISSGVVLNDTLERDTGLPRSVNFRVRITNRRNAMSEITKPSPEQLRETIKRHGLTRGEAALLISIES